MSTNQEIVQRIIAAIREKTANFDFRCPVCNHNTWHVPQDYTYLPLRKDFAGGIRLGGPILPLVPLVCTNCGNTHLLNLKVLGLDLDSLKYAEEKPPEATEAEKADKIDGG